MKILKKKEIHHIPEYDYYLHSPSACCCCKPSTKEFTQGTVVTHKKVSLMVGVKEEWGTYYGEDLDYPYQFNLHLFLPPSGQK